MTQAVIQGAGLQRHYQVSGGLLRKPRLLRAVAGLDFSLSAGKTLAVVGESGCGKSTLARMVAMIEPPTDGSPMEEGARCLASAGKRTKDKDTTPFSSEDALNSVVESSVQFPPEPEACGWCEIAWLMLERV